MGPLRNTREKKMGSLFSLVKGITLVLILREIQSTKGSIFYGRKFSGHGSDSW